MQAANEGGQRGLRSFFSAQKPEPPSNRAPLSTLSSNQVAVSSKARLSSSRPLPQSQKEAAPKRKFNQQAERKNKVQKESQEQKCHEVAEVEDLEAVMKESSRIFDKFDGKERRRRQILFLGDSIGLYCRPCKVIIGKLTTFHAAQTKIKRGFERHEKGVAHRLKQAEQQVEQVQLAKPL